MVEYTLTIGNNKQEISIPTNWNEVSFVQYIGLSKVDLDSNIDVMSVLTGVPSKYLENIPSEKFDSVFQVVISLFEEGVPDLKASAMPKTITIRGKECSTNINPEKILYGYMEGIRLKLREVESNSGDDAPKFHEEFPHIIAYALAGQVITKQSQDLGRETGVYDEERAMELVKEIGNMPVTQIFPIGAFFLKKLLHFWKMQQLNLQLKLVRRKYQQELTNSKSTVHS